MRSTAHRPVTILVALTGGIAGCAFEPNGLASGGPDAAVIDAMRDITQGDATPTEDIHHVAPAQEYLGPDDVRLDGDATIDTTALSVSVGTPAALVPMNAPQDGTGPALAVVHVRDLVVGGTLRATGSRPLVIIARTIIVNGAIEVGARGGVAGAGGHGPSAGPGRGDDGQRHGVFFDTGGGGGGFATAGAVAGNLSGDDGRGGIAYGDPELTSLIGGSGGGSSDGNCGEPPAGAGGGAVQLYASVSISIAGGINAGGGGGGHGKACFGQFTAGRGGGSGGAIYLQSPTVVLDGMLAANGGGGGGSADFSDGGRGDDGALGLNAANGGASGGSGYGARGGDGGTSDLPSAGGNNGGDGNGGGGGGAAGRIVIRARVTQLVGRSSPEAMVAPY